MKLTITIKTTNIDPLKETGVVDLFGERKVLIDDKEVPPLLAKIILLGLDQMTEQYIKRYVHLSS